MHQAATAKIRGAPNRRQHAHALTELAALRRIMLKGWMASRKQEKRRVLVLGFRGMSARRAIRKAGGAKARAQELHGLIRRLRPRLEPLP